MLRPSLPARRVVGVALALTIGTGIGLGAYGIGSASGADTPQVLRTGTTSATTSSGGSDAPGAPGTTTTPEASPSDPLTLDEAVAIAVEFAPGRVVEVDADHGPTGLQYDVTVLHDNGSTTQVEVDTIAGQVTSFDHDNDRD